ncbi:Vacuolar ATPase assembly protein VMA22 [Nakaseomyces bracarensis]|uniref:Vacuolar ATPase assembly protein VMA22 n=1 Tax=Nakaseomyces bracarensis TaxID=273131 RepID=A0ABR4P046_9SACH
MIRMEDKDVLELLKLLSEYDSLLEQLAKAMGDGFANISRANYHNKDALRGKYGKDYWDAAYEGQVEVLCDSTVVDIINRPAKEVSTVKVEEDKVRNRKDRNKSRVGPSIAEEVRSRSYDPILMFGGLSTPSSLRQAQSNFKGCLPLFIQLIKCKEAIMKLSNKDC